MRRRILNIAALPSALLLLIVCFLWVESYIALRSIHLRDPSSVFSVGSYQSIVYINFSSRDQPSGRAEFSIIHESLVMWGIGNYDWDDVLERHFLGFGYAWKHPVSSSPCWCSYGFSMPHWFTALLFLITPSIWIYKRWRRPEEGCCQVCEHNLTGSKGHETCLECGEELRLKVVVAKSKLGAFIVGLIGLSIPLGFVATYLLFGLVFSVFDVIVPETVGTLPAIAIGIFASILLLLIWIQLRHWLRNQSAAMRWTLALACYSVPILHAVVFLLPMAM